MHTTRRQNLATTACGQISRNGLTPQAYGREVHKVFAQLIKNSGDTTLFSEVGYFGKRLATRTGTRWEKDSTVPDAVFGPNELQPTAIFDLKTGKTSITSKWLNQLRGNLPPAYANVPVIELNC